MKEFAGKKILFVVENLSVPFDKRPWREALVMREAGAEVFVICPQSSSDPEYSEVINGIRIFRYSAKFSNGTAFGYFMEYFWSFINTLLLVHKILLLEGKIDAVHVANPPDIFWGLGVYSRLFGIKFVFDEHDKAPETYLSRFEKEENSGGIILKFLRLCQRLSYKYSDIIISTNESYRERTLEICRDYSKKLFVVRNGPDTRYFGPKKPNNTLRRGFRYMGAYIGVMGKQDGVDYIIESMNYLVNKKKFRELIVYLIGSGDEIDYLKELVDRYNLGKYIVFAGRIPDDPALEILSTADIGLSPDPDNPLNDISTMSKLMEFMCLGKAVVSFDLKEARYSAKDAALYVENNSVEAFANGILKLLFDKDLSREMGEYGKRRVERELSWQKQSKHLLRAYSYVFSDNR